MVDWIALTDEAELEKANQVSFEKDVILFKHSTSCSISSMAKMRLESSWAFEDIDAYYLDLLRYKPISNLIADKYKVHHESPQILLIRDGECIYDASHFDITTAEIKETLAFHAK